MALGAPTYDLVLILDPQAEEDVRTRIVGEARTAIEAQGEIVRYDQWGERPLSYPIEKHASGEYHLLQFHAGDPALLAALDHSLRIADGVLRFRVIKLRPGVPEAPDMGTASPRAEQEPAGEERTPAAAGAETA